jgi:hypothetical protein
VARVSLPMVKTRENLIITLTTAEPSATPTTVQSSVAELSTRCVFIGLDEDEDTEIEPCIMEEVDLKQSCLTAIP